METRIMKGRDLLGVPVIDELRLCYLAEPSLLQELASISIGHSALFSGYIFVRIGGDRFEYTFVVFEDDTEARMEIGMIKFGRYGGDSSNQVFFRVNNPILYDRAKMEIALVLPEALGLYFNDITALDIAVDHNKNFSAIIKRMMRNEKVSTILNGRAVKDRKAVIKGISFDYSSSLSRLHCPTITLKQAKATKNKAKGITIQSYDKKAEIECSSGKRYILDRYDNPRYLYRLEVRLNYQELQDYFKKAGIPQTVDVLEDSEFLTELFYYHLGAVLRFSLGRKPLAWKDIILCNGRV